MTRTLTAALCALLLVAAGCGGSDDVDVQGQGDQSGAAAGTEEQAPEATSGDTVQVTMEGFAFSPADVEVQAGQTVRWTNEDSAEHDAVAQGGQGPKSELLGKGETYEWKAAEPGEIDYVCTIHPGMDGTITVTG